MPYLHRAVLRIPPIVPEPAPEEAIADLNLVVLPGTAVLLAGIVAAICPGHEPGKDCPYLRPYFDPAYSIALGD